MRGGGRGEVFTTNIRGVRGRAGKVATHFLSTPTGLPPTRPLRFSSLDALNSFFVSPPVSNSTLPSNLLPYLLTPPFPSSSHFLNSLTLPSSLPSTSSPLPSSLRPGFFIGPQHISTLASTFPRSRRFIIPLPLLSLAPPTLSAPLYRGPRVHSSIPQLPALRTSGVVNLVEPREVGHRGTLKHVTLW